ncbi:hypothetical protein [Alkalihalobacillus pseudalcaliphilus]|uniref:hypothetical protein n=1 Tax=Alkalihalobacillus pseudalcaliphilus TaxID=79884 RepID=UPI00064DB665|nr:hypothetical protein [Alkalihalobacillus pseudalcaliphilus]KMK75121.1 hypothetical protein AB990_16865 [Alkalihalobacillus pseudalcaliphilus]
MDNHQFIMNWGKISIGEWMRTGSFTLSEFLQKAYDLKLYDQKTPDIGRRWTDIEDRFLEKYSNDLTVREASNLLHRSYYATYQRVRILGLNEMIKQKTFS